MADGAWECFHIEPWVVDWMMLAHHHIGMIGTGVDTAIDSASIAITKLHTSTARRKIRTYVYHTAIPHGNETPHLTRQRTPLNTNPTHDTAETAPHARLIMIEHRSCLK